MQKAEGQGPLGWRQGEERVGGHRPAGSGIRRRGGRSSPRCSLRHSRSQESRGEYAGRGGVVMAAGVREGIRATRRGVCCIRPSERPSGLGGSPGPSGDTDSRIRTGAVSGPRIRAGGGRMVNTTVSPPRSDGPRPYKRGQYGVVGEAVYPGVSCPGVSGASSSLVWGVGYPRPGYGRIHGYRQFCGLPGDGLRDTGTWFWRRARSMTAQPTIRGSPS